MVTNPTVISKFNVGTAGGGLGNDRRANLLRVEIDRTVNSVGTWAAFLRNTDKKYTGEFDVQDRVEIGVNGNDLFYGYVDGPAVELLGRDLESDWDEYITLRGVDDAQDLLFHNDFSYSYPIITNTLDTILDDVFNTQIGVSPSSSPIWYVPGFGVGTVGAFEFKAGSSFLTQLQDLMRTPVGQGYLFYVEDDSWELKVGSSLAGITPASGVIVRSRPNDSTNNIIDQVKYQERDGGKLYNYVKLYGKSPQQDGYTEYNAASWTASTIGSGVAVLDDSTTTIRGKSKYSLVVYNENPCDTLIGLKLAIPTPNPLFNYTKWDFTRGEISVWAKYDNIAGAPGTPGAGSCPAQAGLACYLTDTAGNQVDYLGTYNTRLYEGHWGYCTFPVGEADFGATGVDEWHLNVGATFLWNEVVTIEFIGGQVTSPNLPPSHLYIDGLSLPFPILGFARDGPGAGTSEGKYRRRPYDGTWAHITTQNAIQQAATAFLSQSKFSNINKVSFTIPGEYRFRYPGKIFTLDIPSIGVNNSIYYITNLKHIIEPYTDVSNGYGFDWITMVDAVPTSGPSYDMNRLSPSSSYSASQVSQRDGSGIRAM